MKKCNAPLLSKIWDCIEMLNTKTSGEELNITSELESIEISLIKSLNNEQYELFQRYLELLSELNRVCEREAFIKGVKFATAYLAEAVDN